MANILIYLAHPNPESLNGVTAERLAEALRRAGHGVTLRDLYQLDFDPRLSLRDLQLTASGEVVPEVRAEQAAIAAADGLVFVYPVWWWGRPAILKGFVDRVFTKGFAWDYGEQGLIGKLAGKRVFIAATHGASHELYRQLGTDPEHLHDPLTLGSLRFCGVGNTRICATYEVPMYASDAVSPHPERAVAGALAFFTNPDPVAADQL